jgi:hypothetical protein
MPINNLLRNKINAQTMAVDHPRPLDRICIVRQTVHWQV